MHKNVTNAAEHDMFFFFFASVFHFSTQFSLFRHRMHFFARPPLVFARPHPFCYVLIAEASEQIPKQRLHPMTVQSHPDPARQPGPPVHLDPARPPAHPAPLWPARPPRPGPPTRPDPTRPHTPNRLGPPTHPDPARLPLAPRPARPSPLPSLATTRSTCRLRAGSKSSMTGDLR
jgi:hypothetical protein